MSDAAYLGTVAAVAMVAVIALFFGRAVHVKGAGLDVSVPEPARTQSPHMPKPAVVSRSKGRKQKKRQRR